MLTFKPINVSPVWIVGCILIAFCTPALVYADLKIESREYKLLLISSRFHGSDPGNSVTHYWNQLKTLIEAKPIDRHTAGSLTFSKTRTVKFYDTPGTCRLKANGYVFRERIENGEREVVLKYRSPDRYIAAHQNMKGKGSDADPKFEEDIGKPFISKFSHSTKQSIGAGKKLNNMKDPVDLYAGLEEYNFDLNESIGVVSGLTVTEKLYENAKVDLGNKNGKFTLTLWYTSPSSTKPTIAEISFKYSDSMEDYTKKVVTRAKKVFEAMQSMDEWVAENSMTKTAFVYAYSSPDFCN